MATEHQLSMTSSADGLRQTLESINRFGCLTTVTAEFCSELYRLNALQQPSSLSHAFSVLHGMFLSGSLHSKAFADMVADFFAQLSQQMESGLDEQLHLFYKVFILEDDSCPLCLSLKSKIAIITFLIGNGLDNVVAFRMTRKLNPLD